MVDKPQFFSPNVIKSYKIFLQFFLYLLLVFDKNAPICNHVTHISFSFFGKFHTETSVTVPIVILKHNRNTVPMLV